MKTEKKEQTSLESASASELIAICQLEIEKDREREHASLIIVDMYLSLWCKSRQEKTKRKQSKITYSM